MLMFRNQQRVPGWCFCLMAFLWLGSSAREALGQIQPASPQLVDSNGMLVGTVLDYTGSTGEARVPLLIDGHTTILGFKPNSIFILTGINGVFFASADCTGQGFASNFGPEELLEPQAIGGPQNTFYAGPASATTPGSFAYNSVLRGGQACSTESDTLSHALPVSPIRNLTPPWQPPFRIVNVTTALAVPAVSTTGLVLLALALGGLSLLVLRRRAA